MTMFFEYLDLSKQITSMLLNEVLQYGYVTWLKGIHLWNMLKHYGI